MVTITQVLQHYIKKESAEINRLKQIGVERVTVEKYAYRSPDGKTFRNRLPEGEEAGWCWDKVSFEKLIGHMSPKHAHWQQYRAAKARVSLLLTARNIVKIYQESVPDIKQLRIALKKGLLSHHCPTARQRSLAYRAFRYLRKLNNRLTRAPERFREVET